jgi:hypothetical protein
MFSGKSWTTMLHGVAFMTNMDESGARGGDDRFSTNWLMVSATRRVGRGSLMFRSMLSAEPWTIRDRRYPLLFQTGETAFGRPIIDGQHPHDLFMELAVEYGLPIGSGVGFAYLAKHGDPALGPVAFPHHPSASEIPQAVLAHHYQDSTHIATNVVTLGYRIRNLMLETSGFHGGEPDEKRTDIESGAIDSASARITWTPTPRIVAQVSAGHLETPEPLHPGNATRRTASLAYDAPLAGSGRWTSTVVWGQVAKQSHRSRLDAYLAETLVNLGRRNWFTARVERNEKDELFPHFHNPNRPDLAGAVPTFTVNSLLMGYTFDVITHAPLRVGIGGNVTLYRFPQQLDAFYGERPMSRALFVRARLTSN